MGTFVSRPVRASQRSCGVATRNLASPHSPLVRPRLTSPTPSVRTIACQWRHGEPNSRSRWRSIVTQPVFLVHRASRPVVWAFLLVACSALALGAQTGRIVGIVTDSAAGRPVPSVNLLVIGSTLGTVTADDGRYVIAGVAPGTYTVEARRLGYAPVRRAGIVVGAGQTATADFRVQTAALHLQETVITGVVDPTAGTKVPFSVGRVTKEDAPVPPMNAIAAIQGKVAGVAVMP